MKFKAGDIVVIDGGNIDIIGCVGKITKACIGVVFPYIVEFFPPENWSYISTACREFLAIELKKASEEEQTEYYLKVLRNS